MAKNKTKMKARRRMLFLGLTSIAIIFVMTFTIGRYWVEIFDNYIIKSTLGVSTKEELLSLKEKAEELKVDANKLQNPDYVARYAREKYLYSKEGEFILQIPEE